jgi:hypothetical protein
MNHEGQTILVMGGARSLDADMAKLTEMPDVVISVNGHGAEYPHDYLLAMDDRHGANKQDMIRYLRNLSPAPIIGPQKKADHKITRWPMYPRRCYSGMAAIWMAQHMSAARVIVAGMDGYGNCPKAIRQAKAVGALVHIPVMFLSGPLGRYFKGA